MTLRNAGLVFFLLTLEVLSAASKYKITLLRATKIGTTDVPPGDYSFEVDGDKAVFKGGGKTVEARVAMESAPNRNPTTSLVWSLNSKLKSISIKGTNLTYVLTE
ncbi:MAG: hypothetical protein ABI811_08735 [Acidobacteriota bacterium]